MKCSQEKCNYDADVLVTYQDKSMYPMCTLHAISALSFDVVTISELSEDIELPQERLDILNYI